jgi:hypothetical protein
VPIAAWATLSMEMIDFIKNAWDCIEDQHVPIIHRSPTTISRIPIWD